MQVGLTKCCFESVLVELLISVGPKAMFEALRRSNYIFQPHQAD